jgi:YD repeat-containing protein
MVDPSNGDRASAAERRSSLTPEVNPNGAGQANETASPHCSLATSLSSAADDPSDGETTTVCDAQGRVILSITRGHGRVITYDYGQHGSLSLADEDVRSVEE